MDNTAAIPTSASATNETGTTTGGGKGFRLREQLWYVEQYRFLQAAIKVKQWDNNYNIIKLQVDEFGRDVNFARRGRSFIASWRNDFENKFESDAGGVDMAAIEERMDHLREICKTFNPEDIYNADEIGFYLRESSKWSYTTASKTGGIKPDRHTMILTRVTLKLSSPGNNLQIERLAPNSTSVTQPRDAGIISVFKCKFLGMLDSQTLTKLYGGKKVSNGEA
ncbi:hypothetical protein BGW41_005957 [Actinomortierella wolfii]|nr:hypothetical protein BGW41_005957 [Actinomortierella wolfii]